MDCTEMIHKYEGVNGSKAHCGVQIFEGRDGTPIVVLSEAPDSEGSVDVLVECIAAEVLETLLPTRIGQTHPFYCIEHYPREEASALGETFDLVTFERSSPVLRWTHGSLRITLGLATRRPIWRRDLERMIGDKYCCDFLVGPSHPKKLRLSKGAEPRPETSKQARA